MDDIPLIPRKALFGNPDRAGVQISPDGRHMSWLAPLDGVINVWVASVCDLVSARPLTRDKGRGIRTHFWAYTNNHVLFMQDTDGDENWRLYCVDIVTAESRNLTPFEKVRTRVIEVSHKVPGEIVIGVNNRDPQRFDVYRLDILTGEMTLMLQNDDFSGVWVDDDYRLRYAWRFVHGGGTEISSREGDTWKVWDTIGADDALTTRIIGWEKNNRTLFMCDSRGRDTSAILAVDPETKKARFIAGDSKVDAGDVMRHPTKRHVQAVSFNYTRKRWEVLDKSIVPDMEYLRSTEEGDVEIVGRTLDDTLWVTVCLVDNGPARYYLYDRKSRTTRFLFTNRKELENHPLVKMHPVVIRSRDGTELVAYYSLPPGSDSKGDGRPDKPVPMVLAPHGGPHSRDRWGFNGTHQWLANRGYAVLSVNFRASTGFGKAFLNAGNRQWGGTIIEDQVDAVRWAIGHGIADPGKVAVMGGSFGGYSALAGLTFTPALFACAVDVFGPSNLVTASEDIPPYWKPMVEHSARTMGDHRTEEGRALLRRHSPLTYVDRICRPLLIGQGANDVRVRRSESDQIVQAMQERKIPVTYVVYPDEGHGFARPENNISFCAIAEVFLSKCLGGRCEPIGSDLDRSSLQVPVGAENIVGLAAMGKRGEEKAEG